MTTHTALEAKSAPKGLKGWLLLVGADIVLSFFGLLISLSFYFFLGRDFYREKLVGSDLFLNSSKSTWSVLQDMEILYLASLLIAMTYLGYLFFKKKKQFPLMFIWTHLAGIAFVLLDWSASTAIYSFYEGSLNSAMADLSIRHNLLLAVLEISIIGTYLMKSKRVASTFVEA